MEQCPSFRASAQNSAQNDRKGLFFPVRSSSFLYDDAWPKKGPLTELHSPGKIDEKNGEHGVVDTDHHLKLLKVKCQL